MSATVLREADDLQAFSTADLAFIGLERPREELEQRGLAAAVRADQSNANAGRKRERQILEQPPSAEGFADALGFDQALGLAVGRGEIDLGGAAAGAGGGGGKFVDEASGGIDASARFAGAGFGSAAKPLDLTANFGGKGVGLLLLGLEKVLAPFEKFAVIALHLERAAGIDAIEFEHVGGDAFEKVAIVCDH